MARAWAAAAEIDAEQVRLHRRIGSGGFAEVFLGTVRGKEVAVKRLLGDFLGGGSGADNDGRPLHPAAAKAQRDFEREVAMLARMRHPSLVGFVGVVRRPLCLVTEFCSRGSLFDVIRRFRKPRAPPGSSPEALSAELAAPLAASAAARDAGEPSYGWDVGLGWSARLRLAVDVASCVAYLHGQTPVVMHRDLKSLNVLVTSDWRARVADLGLARLRGGTGSVLGSVAGGGAGAAAAAGSTGGSLYTQQVGSFHWMPPEVIAGGRYAEQADAFSFGVILWELAMGTTPYAGMTPVAVAYAVLHRG